jgi:transketolase
MKILDTEQLAAQIRVSALEMVAKAKASHIGSALSIADIVAVLYGKVLFYNNQNPDDSNRDRFILSKGHACVAVYAALAECGFFEKIRLQTYGEDHSPLMNHITHKVPGVEFSTGALGHGFSFGVGKALASKMKSAKWRTFVLLSDGELDEGSNWEALMFASHHGLSNLCAIVDYNKLQSMDSVSKTLALEPLREKFLSFGAKVIEVDGHNHHELINALADNPTNAKPVVVICHTIKGKGISFMENQVRWHYQSPNAEELLQARLELNCNA